MSKFAKVALIIAIAAVAMAAKQFISPDEQKLTSAVSATPGASISPAELTRAAGPLPETKIDSLF
jgi:hypothetical protein